MIPSLPKTHDMYDIGLWQNKLSFLVLVLDLVFVLILALHLVLVLFIVPVLVLLRKLIEKYADHNIDRLQRA